MNCKKNGMLIFVFCVFISCTRILPPKPIYPVPTKSQLVWQEMEFYGFLHFSINTFTDDEWGYGDKSPKLFNPTQLDVNQWVKIAKEAGMKGLILTNKHHDGFCLWPSKYNDYSVKNSPWKNGKGDVVKELAEACKKAGLKMGIYLSPWDRNHPDYGKPEYITYFRNQLTELLTNYGDIFEVWFDGANGGDGYYGGAKENRYVDKKNYYDWENTNKLIRKLQPNAIIWSDAGPDARWVGNEHGFAYKTTWSPLLKDSVYGGMPNYNTKYAMGQEKGTHWVPAEADVSIRPNWYYHKSEDDKVKSLQQLLNIYYKSVGQNSTLLLNLPIDRRGLIHENDLKQLQKLRNQLDLDFDHNLTLEAKISATNTRGNSSSYSSKNTVDNNSNTYWATDDAITKASIEFTFKKPTTFNRFLAQEYISLGQRIKEFSLEALNKDGSWQTISKETTIGYKHILRFEPVTTTKIRFTIHDSKGCPLISNLEIYNAPLILDTPIITRSKDGIVKFNLPENTLEVYYTKDGSIPTLKSTKLTENVAVKKPTTINAFSYDKITNRKSDVITTTFDIHKKHWKLIPENKTVTAIDDNKKSNYTFPKNNELIINLGKTELIKGFTYTPTQSRWVSGVITHYTFYGSINGKTWKQLSTGEFSNIIANPITRKTLFKTATSVRYIKLKATKVQNNVRAIIAELGVITK